MKRKHGMRCVAPALVIMLVALAPGQALAAQSLIGIGGWWRFNENAGTVVHDSSGHANDGTLSDSNAWTTGKFGSALDFAGGAYVRVPNDPTLESQNITAEAWVKYAGAPGNFKYILAKGANSNFAASYALDTGNGGGIRFYVADCSTFAGAFDGSGAIWDGAWHRVTGTYGGGFVRLYVDGIEVASTPTNLVIQYDLTTVCGQDTNDLSSGTYLAGTDPYGFPGAIDEPRVWTRTLSASDVADSAGPTVTPSSSTVLLGSTSATLSATASDPYGVVGGEYAIDTGSGFSAWAPMTQTDSDLSVTINPSALAVGTYPVKMRATDYADNTSTPVSTSLNVQYRFVGFAQPVDNNVVNVAKAGQAIPLKWQLLDANNVPVTTLSGVSVKVTGFSCSLSTSTDLVEQYASGSSGLQNLGGGFYQFNWKTPSSYARSCKTLTLDLGDGNVLHTAQFQFTK